MKLLANSLRRRLHFVPQGLLLRERSFLEFANRITRWHDDSAAKSPAQPATANTSAESARHLLQPARQKE